MSPEQIETARRLVAAAIVDPGEGMEQVDHRHASGESGLYWTWIDISEVLPDLSDGKYGMANGGVLLGTLQRWCTENTRDRVRYRLHVQQNLDGTLRVLVDRGSSVPHGLASAQAMMDGVVADGIGTLAHAAALVLLEV